MHPREPLRWSPCSCPLSTALRELLTEGRPCSISGITLLSVQGHSVHSAEDIYLMPTLEEIERA